MGTDFVLLLLVASTGISATTVPVPVGHFRSLESCVAAANETKTIGTFTPFTYGFMCIRDNDLPISRNTPIR